MSDKALWRHKDQHIPAAVAEAKQEATLATAIDAADSLRLANTATRAALKLAATGGDAELMLKASDRLLKQVEFHAKVTGAIGPEPEAQANHYQQILNIIADPQAHALADQLSAKVEGGTWTVQPPPPLPGAPRPPAMPST